MYLVFKYNCLFKYFFFFHLDMPDLVPPPPTSERRSVSVNHSYLL